MEIKKEVKRYKIYKVCPQCEEGYMKSTNPYTLFGNLLFGDNNNYEHTCSKCGFKESYDCIYPCDEIEEIEV